MEEGEEERQGPRILAVEVEALKEWERKMKVLVVPVLMRPGTALKVYEMLEEVAAFSLSAGEAFSGRVVYPY